MAKAAGAREGDLIAFGHTHKPWTRVASRGSSMTPLRGGYLPRLHARAVPGGASEIELRMKTWLEHPEAELPRLREQRERERLGAARREETMPVGGARYEGHDPFRCV